MNSMRLPGGSSQPEQASRGENRRKRVAVEHAARLLPQKTGIYQPLRRPVESRRGKVREKSKRAVSIPPRVQQFRADGPPNVDIFAAPGQRASANRVGAKSKAASTRPPPKSPRKLTRKTTVRAAKPECPKAGLK